MAAYCKDCNSTIDEAAEAAGGRAPCPVCGSLRRNYEEELSSSLIAGTDVGLKGYAAGMSRGKGLKFEAKYGDSHSHSLGRFVKRDQLVDREGNRYLKKVVDPQTREVLRDVDEPLSDHQGRGSAREHDT